MPRVELPIEAFVNRWHDCQECNLAATRRRIVLYRGSVPANILLCGEAPGASENMTGQPFTGPAGHKLEEWLAQTVEPGLTWALCNLVCCLPIYGGLKGNPEHDEIMACQPRLEEFIALVKPRLLVAVGQVAWDYLEQGFKYSVDLPEPRPRLAHITHPSAILQARPAQKGQMERRAIVTLANALEKEFGHGEGGGKCPR